jgi:hypothetical protein
MTKVAATTSHESIERGTSPKISALETGQNPIGVAQMELAQEAALGAGGARANDP